MSAVSIPPAPEDDGAVLRTGSGGRPASWTCGQPASDAAASAVRRAGVAEGDVDRAGELDQRAAAHAGGEVCAVRVARDDGGGHSDLADPVEDVTDDLARERGRVEAPLARDDERRAGERLAEPDDLRDELRAGDETGSERRKATGEPARRAGPGQLADVDAVVRAVARGELRQPALELRDCVRIGSLLRAEDRRCVDERRRHVARDDDLRSPEVEVERLERPDPAVHGRRPADRDEDVLDALVESCADQLAGPHGRRGERVVRAGDEGEAARARHLDDRGAAAHAPLGVDRRSERPGDTGRPAVGRLRAEDVQRALAAVREWQPERRAADPLDPVCECCSGRARTQTAAELVRAAENRPVGRHAA